jgi:hypothetical protein
VAEWFEHDPRRLNLEMNLLARAASGRWGRIGKTLVYDETLTARGMAFAIRIAFPSDFPFSPPRAHLLSPAVPNVAELHKFSNGVLCLHDTHEWHPRATALWLRNRAAAWANAYAAYCETGEWPGEDEDDD